MKLMHFLRTGLAAAVVVVTASAAQARDIVDIAVGSENHKTLVAALQAAGLVETLQGKGPFTVFAPTDDAFAALPEGTVESLLKPENKDQLVSILTYHVVPGRVTAGSLGGKQVFAETVQGQTVYATGISSSGVYIGNGSSNNYSKLAKVLAQVQTGNGIVHVIDKVLLPK